MNFEQLPLNCPTCSAFLFRNEHAFNLLFKVIPSSYSYETKPRKFGPAIDVQVFPFQAVLICKNCGGSHEISTPRNMKLKW